MRRIEIVEGLTVGFPGRDETFIEGFELGLLAASLASGAPELAMQLGRASVEQARDLAQALGYGIVPGEPAGDTATVEVHFRSRAAKPRLRLVR